MCDVLEGVELAVPEVHVSLLVGLVGILLSSTQGPCALRVLTSVANDLCEREAVLTSHCW